MPCLFQGSGQHGWCGNCLKNAEPNTYGYCDWRSSHQNNIDPEHITRSVKEITKLITVFSSVPHTVGPDQGAGGHCSFFDKVLIRKISY